MEVKDYVTNVGLSLCLTCTSSFSSDFMISQESKLLFDNYDKITQQSSYNTNISQSEISKYKDVDIYALESYKLITIIKKELGINIDNQFIPNKENNIKTTLFITCDTFRDLCNKEQYEDALILENQINETIAEKLKTTKSIGRVAFL